MLSQELLEEKKENLLDILKAFIALCDAHKLKYYAAYGTVIGAARHHGFIPWDDDIDVYMPRWDYNRFVELMSSRPPVGYDLFEISVTPNYNFSYAKFCDAHTTILEYSTYRLCTGNFIDIFPIDGFPEGEKETMVFRKKMLKTKGRLMGLARYYSWRDILGKIVRLQMVAASKDVVYKLFRMPIRKALSKKLLKNMSKYSGEESKYIGFVGSVVPKEGKFTHDMFGEGAMLPFEGLQLRVPSKYDEYLKSVYGNWRQLPPKEHQCSSHQIAYINLKKRMAYKEVIEILSLRHIEN